VAALSVVAVFLAVLAPAASAATPGLVAAYGFDDASGTVAADASGNGNAGTVLSGTWTTGKFGGALSFNGTSSRVQIPGSASLNLSSAVTLEAWVFPTSLGTAWQAVAIKQQTKELTYGLYANSNVKHPAGIVYTGSSEKTTYGPSQLPLSTWSHVAMTYDGSVLAVYVNGALVSSQLISGLMATSATGALSIGGDTIWSEWFSGKIDELRVYNRALNAAAISADMIAPVNGSAPADTTPPSTPTGLAASAATQTSVKLSWTASTDNTAVTGYDVFNGSTNTATTAATSATLTGLTCGTSYSLGADAFDAAGNHSAKASITATTAACADTQAPTVPSAFASTSRTASSISVDWTASTDNVGVTGYDVSNGLNSTTMTATSSTVTGLTCGTSYSLGVDAFDAAGNHSANSSITTTTSACADTQAPSIPGALAATGSTTTSISLGWNASTDNVGVTGYDVFNGGTITSTTAATSATLTGLTCGTSYSLGADSFDAAGNHSAVSTITATTSACSDTQAPSVPSSLATTGSTTTSIDLGWAASTDNVGVTGYGVYNGALAGSTTTATTYTVTGLTCGTSYTLGVDAVDAASNRSAKATVTASTSACADTQAPSSPAGLAKTTGTTTSISLGWTASTDNVGVTGYGVYNGALAGSTTTATTYTVTGLTCGTSYSLGVDAVDAAGNRSAKAAVTASTSACADTQAPTAPGALAATGSTTTSISLGWSASTDNVGVTGYDVFNGSTITSTSAATSATVSGLTCGTSYGLGADSFDAAGNHSAKTTITASTAACSVPPPAGNANLWVDTNGGSCSRQATAGAYADASACSSFQAAYTAAQCGDTVGVRAGSYGSQSISSGAKSCTSTTQVLITSAPGATCANNTTVSLPSFSISVAYLKLQCMNANPAGTTSCGNVSGSSGAHTSIIWISLDQMAIHCAFFDSDHLHVSNTTFGPDNTCQTAQEDLIDFRANSTSINDVGFDHVTFATVTAPPDFECGLGHHVDSMQGYGISNLIISNSEFYGCPGQCIIFRPYAGGTPGPITIQNTIFNQAQSPGQAIDIGSSTASDGDNCVGPILIQNNTFVNGAALHGGCWNTTSVIIRDNIMSSSTCNFGGSSDVYSYNVFYSGAACGSNSKSCTPAYVANTTSLTSPGDFHLASTDTCAVGAADQANHAATDMDGQSRPQGATVDAGADDIGGGGTGDTTSPTAALSAPAGGSSVSGNVVVSATAADNVGVAGVQFTLDGNALGAEDTSAPYSVTWDSTTATAGSHVLAATVRDAAGNHGNAAGVSVTAAGSGAAAPTVSFTAPNSGSTLSGNVAVNADAASGGTVAGVQFKLDGTNLGATDTTAPYQAMWNTTGATNASHTLVATATDAAGNSTSATETVNVANGTPSAIVIKKVFEGADSDRITHTFALTAAVPAGDTLVLTHASTIDATDGGIVTPNGVSDQGGNVWSQAAVSHPGTSFSTVEVWTASVTKALPAGAIVTVVGYSRGLSDEIAIFDVQGLAANPAETSAGFAGYGNNPATPYITPTTAHALLVAVHGQGSAGAPWWTPEATTPAWSNLVDRFDASNSRGIAVDMREVTVQAAYRSAGTISSASTSNNVIVALRAAG
jgi:chitodextrinase